MSIQFHHPFQESQFDIFEWYSSSQSCLKFFLNHAQHNQAVQSVASVINIQLPFQQSPAVAHYVPPASSSSPDASRPSGHAHQPYITLVPFVRRLVVTGFDSPSILHGFFGDDWPTGIGPVHEIERRNYLFAAKSDTWLRVKHAYDMGDGQLVPYLRPLQNVTEKEIQAAEAGWSDWLAMQDWMLGPRAPPGVSADERPIVKADGVDDDD